MTPGSCTEGLSGFGRAGIPIRDFTFEFRELRLAWALESASLADLVGAGDTGVTIGTITGSCSTTAPTSPTAEFLSISIPSIAPVGFTELVDSMEPVDFM